MLAKEKGKKVYIYKKELGMVYLRQLFGWRPKNLVDARDVARRIGTGDRLIHMTEKLVGGPFCLRGINFSGISTPSQVALRHIDLVATLIRKFCTRFQQDRARSRGRSHERDRGSGSQTDRVQPDAARERRVEFYVEPDQHRRGRESSRRSPDRRVVYEGTPDRSRSRH